MWIEHHLPAGWCMNCRQFYVAKPLWPWGRKDDAYCSDGCAETQVYDHWLCSCGSYIEDGLHCELCGSEPPWGCGCSLCDDIRYEESGHHDDDGYYDPWFDPFDSCLEEE